MEKLSRFFVAAVLGMTITIGLILVMIALITLNKDAPEINNNLTTQVKSSASTGTKVYSEINSEIQIKHHQIPAERKINLPIDPKSLVSQITAQRADNNQTGSIASESQNPVSVKSGSQREAQVKIPGMFNVMGPDPKYPDFALSAGQEGWVETLIHLNKDGTVNKVEIINANPAGVFELSVVSAVTKWKVKLNNNNEAQSSHEYFHRFEFKISH